MPNSPFHAAMAAALSLSPLLTTANAQETRIEEVVVTSTALRENPLEVAQPTEVLGGDELRRQIAASLGETLAGELGVSSTYFGPSASQPVIRGLGGYRVQVLQDGLASLDVSSLSQDHAVSIESVVAQQIEIIKGPASLLYGSGAAGGLINVVTNRIPTNISRPLGAVIELRGDTATQERTGALSIDGARGPLALHADYFDRSTHDVEIPGYAQSAILRQALIEAGETPNGIRGFVPNSGSDSRGGALGAALVGSAGYAGLAWNRYESTYGVPAEEEAFIDLHQDRFDARGEWRAGGGWLDTLHVSAAYSDYAHTEFEAPGEPATKFEQSAYEARLAADHHWSAHWRGTLGAQHVMTDLAAIGEEAFVPPVVSRASSVFAFEERHLGRSALEFGVRAERQTHDPHADLPGYAGTALNVSAGIVFKPHNDHAVALNLTRTERHPQPAELYADGPHLAAGRVEIGDPTLGKETALTMDLSFRATGKGLRWTLNAFYNDYAEFIFLDPTGGFADSLPVFQYMQGGAKLYGYEAELIFPVISTANRKVELRLASDYVRGKLDDGSNLPQIPPLRVGLGTHFETGRWHASLEAFYNARQDKVIEHELPTASYTMLDADVSYRLPFGARSTLIFLRGTNLLDEDARLATSPLKDIAPLPGRSLHFGVRMEL